MLVWTFILERTVVVYLASTYPKNDLQSRGRSRMRLHLPRLYGPRQTTEDEDTHRPTRPVGTGVSSANMPPTQPWVRLGCPGKGHVSGGERVETGPVVVAKLRIWKTT